MGKVHAAPFTDLVPRYNRLISNVMARKIASPTAATLDFAAYTANPVLAEAGTPVYKRPATKAPIDSITFGGKIGDIKDRIDGTPLTDLDSSHACKDIDKEMLKNDIIEPPRPSYQGSD